MLDASSIYVLAGTNGAGKSSVGAATFTSFGVTPFNPDEAARSILDKNPGSAQLEANMAAWREEKRLLEHAIRERLDFAFETTLGGHTITARLEKAALAGIQVRIWYVALKSPELHIGRVRARVIKGGHDVPEARIRERYDQSRLNLIRLMPRLSELFVYDNSGEADPDTGAVPKPLLVSYMINGKITAMCDFREVPDWAKPILAATLQLAK